MSDTVRLDRTDNVVFDNAPDRWTSMGAAVVVAAGLVIWIRERRVSRSLAA